MNLCFVLSMTVVKLCRRGKKKLYMTIILFTKLSLGQAMNEKFCEICFHKHFDFNKQFISLYQRMVSANGI